MAVPCSAEVALDFQLGIEWLSVVTSMEDLGCSVKSAPNGCVGRLASGL